MLEALSHNKPFGGYDNKYNVGYSSAYRSNVNYDQTYSSVYTTAQPMSFYNQYDYDHCTAVNDSSSLVRYNQPSYLQPAVNYDMKSYMRAENIPVPIEPKIYKPEKTLVPIIPNPGYGAEPNTIQPLNVNQNNAPQRNIRNPLGFSNKVWWSNATAFAEASGYSNYFYAEFSYYILRALMPHRNTTAGRSLNQFCHTFMQTCRPTLPNLLLSLFYLGQVRNSFPTWLSQQPQDQLLVASMMLASKYIDDVPLPNGSWAHIGNFDNRSLNALEFELFENSGYCITFEASTFRAWRIQFDQFVLFKSYQSNFNAYRIPTYDSYYPPANHACSGCASCQLQIPASSLLTYPSSSYRTVPPTRYLTGSNSEQPTHTTFSQPGQFSNRIAV